MYVTTLIYSKRYIRTYRMPVRVYIFNRLVWLIMICLTVPKMEIDIPKKGIVSRSRPVIVVLISAQYYDSTAGCDFSLAMMKRIDLKWINIFHWKTVIFTAVRIPSFSLLHKLCVIRMACTVYRGHPNLIKLAQFNSKSLMPFLYVSPILLGNVVLLNLIASALVSLPRPRWKFSGYRWILFLAKVHPSHMTVSLKEYFTLHDRM